jgi:DNA-binding MurR/RpiR family transcriptional regulator
MQAPRTFDELKGRIARQYEALSGRLRQIAEFALGHPNEMALGTVAAIADAAGVQPSSIVRFAHRFGFEGFSDMQQVFRSRLVAASPGYRERIAALRAEPAARRGNGRAATAATAAPDAVLAGFVGDGIAALQHLQSVVDKAALRRAVALLAGARTVYCLAQGRAFPVAFYAYYALNRLERRAALLDGIGGMLRDQARHVAAGDVVLAVSFKEYSPDVVLLVEELAERGIDSIAVTDNALAPIARRARVTLETGDDPAQPFRSLVAPMCLAQSLVVALGHHLESRGAAS